MWDQERGRKVIQVRKMLRRTIPSATIWTRFSNILSLTNIAQSCPPSLQQHWETIIQHLHNAVSGVQTTHYARHGHILHSESRMEGWSLSAANCWLPSTLISIIIELGTTELPCIREMGFSHPVSISTLSLKLQSPNLAFCFLLILMQCSSTL